MRRRTLGSATLVATMALAGSGLVLAPPAAQAAPVFTTSTFQASSFAHDDASPGCTPSGAVEQPTTTVPVTENGGVASLAAASSVTLTAADPADVMGGAASINGSGAVSSSGTTLKSIDHVGQGSLNVTSTLAKSACDMHMFAVTTMPFTFVVNSPGFLTIDVTRTPGAYTEFYLQTDTPDNSDYYDEYASGLTSKTSRRLYLPAGTYNGYTTIDTGVDDRSTAFSGSPTASIHATFALAGSQSVAASGKATKYVTLPTARSCATHTVTASVTGKKKRAAQVKEVAFFLNDAKVKTVKTPKKGAAVTIAVADSEDAELRTEVTLFPKRRGAKGKVSEATVSFVPCTG